MQRAQLAFVALTIISQCYSLASQPTKPGSQYQKLRVAFLRDGNVWVMNTDGTQQQQPTGVNYTKTLWLSSSVLVFLGSAPQEQSDIRATAGLYRYDMAKLKLERMFTVKLPMGGFHMRLVSRRGTSSQVVLCIDIPEGFTEVYLLDLEKRKALLFDAYVPRQYSRIEFPSWSPDGSQVVFIARRMGASQPLPLYYRRASDRRVHAHR